MYIEKKLIACCILAISIGIATIVPLEYLMAAQAQPADNIQTLAAEPLFDVNALYVNCNLNHTRETLPSTLYGATINGLLNMTVLKPNPLQEYDAKIEYYQFRVYSDEGPIVNMTFCVGYANLTLTWLIEGDGTIGFTNGLTYNGTLVDGGLTVGDGFASTNNTGFLCGEIVSADPNSPPQAVTQLRNADTLYIDVYRQCTLTVKGEITVMTPENNDVLQHMVLTKTSTGFTYGTYSAGMAPIPPKLITG
ncbi:MAG: hypothetical protein NWF00_08310 [Candidatus Bathyarchaeota archaeon]|nr:hypothetical protein [Candidatus Bathyarchaeota archaeon]